MPESQTLVNPDIHCVRKHNAPNLKIEFHRYEKNQRLADAVKTHAVPRFVAGNEHQLRSLTMKYYEIS